MFNSHSLSRLSYSASLKPRVSHTLDWSSFRPHFVLNCSRNTSLSFVLSSAMKYIRSHRTTIICTLSPHSSFYTNIMYIHSSMVTTTTTSTQTKRWL